LDDGLGCKLSLLLASPGCLGFLLLAQLGELFLLPLLFRLARGQFVLESLLLLARDSPCPT
jgi:hypothetical protein